MSQAPSDANGSDPVFSAFQRGFEEAADRAAYLGEMCARHGERAREFRDYAGVAGLLREAGGQAEEPMPDRLGEFELRRRIGRSMGEVFEAWQPSLQRKVAVKMVRQGRTSAAVRERFDREQKVLARLHQTHIVSIHAAGEVGPLQYFVMPFIDGASLHHVVYTARSCRGSTPPLSKLAEMTASVRGRPTVSPSAAAREEPPERVEPPKPARGVALSIEYYRSVAQVMADAAEAVEYAHGEGVIHRDLKPANLMVDRQGHCWLIDFGLAGADDVWVAGATNGPGTISGVMGTPPYMAPEQFQGKADQATDVYGLGVTLYELLTLRPAFEDGSSEEVMRRVLSEAPPRPRDVAAGTPRDLEAICRKAMHREWARRYATAGEFAADLRRWLRGEPTKARPAWVGRRVWLWARRNKALATAIGTAVVLAVALGAFFLQRARTAAAEARAETAEAREEASREREAAAEQREKDRQHEALVLALQGERLTTRPTAGWFDQVWPKVKPAAAIRGGADLRSQAVATLQGMDVVSRKRWEKYTAYSLAFDAKGRLLMGGWGDAEARVWDGSILPPTTSKQVGYGPAAYRRDGTALQLAFNPKEPYRFTLWDVTKQAALRTLEIPDAKGRGMPPNTILPRMSLSADGALAAIAVKLPDGGGLLALWDTETGKLFHRFAVHASSLAFSTPGEKGPEFLAAGHEDGGVTIWSLPKGEKAVALKVGKAAVTALAFGPEVRRGDGRAEKTGLSRWLLAVGQAGGDLSIWEPATSTVRAFCIGSANDIYTIAFSPDGMTLASAGRAEPKLWDVVTGRLLLNLENRGHTYALAFSQSGKQLAISSRLSFDNPGGIEVWEILPGRGVQSLRGIVGQFERVAWSRDGRRIAAVGHNWQVAVWDREANKLLHVFEPPPGLFADNVGLAFSPDGRRLAFSALRNALLWDLDTGQQLRSWVLPMGFQDHLLYSGSDRLVLFRVETANPNVPPFGNWPADHPRICRVRNLLAKDPKPIDLKGFNWNVKEGAASPSQNCFVIDGFNAVGEEVTRSIKAFDAVTGAVRWAVPVLMMEDASDLSIDPLGELATATLRHRNDWQVIEVSSGRLLPDRDGGRLGPKGALRFDRNEDFFVGGKAKGPVFRFGIDGPVASGRSFNAAGTHFAWATTDGVLSVCDLAAVHERLAAVGLEW